MGALFGALLGAGCFAMFVYLAIIALIIISWWKVFTKAGKPGWAAIIPIYNFIVFLEILRKPLWWIVLLLIPVVNFVVMIILWLELARVFGKSSGFALGLFFLGPIFFPILAFGDAKYVGSSTAVPPPAPGAPPIQ
jgi:hypothetical protein